jgi:Lrp/AsnC family leucine-responsive transcriptional regulator
MARRLDEIDKRIIYALVKDARNISAPMIADEVDVSDGTIRNRIDQLEEAGIIRGYHADINYERCEGRLTNLFICNASVGERQSLAREVLTIPGVVNVREIRTGRGNLQIKAVGEDASDLTRIAQQINRLGLDIEDEDLIQQEYFAPYELFGPENGAQTDAMTDMMALSGGAEVVDVTVAEDAPIVGETLVEATENELLDEEILVIAIEREDEIITPKGDTKIQAGDLISVFARDGVPEPTLAAFGGSPQRTEPN